MKGVISKKVMNKAITIKGVCEVPAEYSYCKNQAEQILVGYFLKAREKIKACEICYQGTKPKQWEMNWQRKWKEAKWFYFYDEARQNTEDALQKADYNQRKNCRCFKTQEFYFNQVEKKWIEEEINYLCDYCKENK